MARADAYKYELKAALDQIDRRLPDGPAERAPRGSDGDVYTKAGKFSFVAGGAYVAATTVFGPVRAETRSLSRTTDGRLRLSEAASERSYPALEALHGADDERFSPIPFLARVFAGPKVLHAELGAMIEWGEPIKALVAQTDVRGDRVRYQFIFRYARDLLEIFRLDDPELPPNWRFPWGTLKVVAEVFAALATRAFYHLVAINFGAARRGLVGCGVDQICLVTEPADLAKDLARLLGRSVEDVRLVLDALSYGAGVRTPDPALQPLIPIGKGRIVVPPFLVLTSNWARNMLSLHARVDPKSFDAQSHLFEAQMVARLASQADSRWRVWVNRHVPTKPKREEIDLILADETSRTLLLCELRWMIQPCDIREVLERQRVCGHKVAQALRKRDRVRDHMTDVLRDLALDASAAWRIEALVIIDNFGGGPSPAPKEVPVVPRKVLEQALDLAPNLDRLHAAFTTSVWLPREGADFHKDYQTIDLGGVEIELPLFGMGAQAYIRDNVGVYLSAAYARTPEDLRAEAW